MQQRRRPRLLLSPLIISLSFGFIWKTAHAVCNLPVIYPEATESIARQSLTRNGPVERLLLPGIDMNLPFGTKPDILPLLLLPGPELKVSCIGATPTLSLENGELIAQIPLNADNLTEIGCEFMMPPSTLQSIELGEDFFRPNYVVTIEPGFTNLTQVVFDWERDQITLSVSSPKLTILQPISDNRLVIENGGLVRSSGGRFPNPNTLAIRGRVHGGEVNFINTLYLQGPILAPITGNSFGGSTPVNVHSSFGCSQVMIDTCQPIGVDISKPQEPPCTLPYCFSECTRDGSGYNCVGGLGGPDCFDFFKEWQHDPVGGQQIAPPGYEDDCSKTDFVPYNTTWSGVGTILVDYNFPENSLFNTSGLAALTIRPVDSTVTTVSTTPSDAIGVEFLVESGTLVLSPGDLKGRIPERVGILVEVPAEELLRVEMVLSDWVVRLESGFTNFQRIVTQLAGVLFAELSSESEVVLESPFSFASVTVQGGALVSREIEDNLAIKGNIINGTGGSFLQQIYVEGEIIGSLDLETKLVISTSCDNVMIPEFGGPRAECTVMDTLEVSLPRPFCTMPYCYQQCDRDEVGKGCVSFDCLRPDWFHNAGVTVAPTTTAMPVFASGPTTAPSSGTSSPSLSQTRSPAAISVDGTMDPTLSPSVVAPDGTTAPTLSPSVTAPDGTMEPTPPEQPVMSPVVPTTSPTATTPSPVASGAQRFQTLAMSGAVLSLFSLVVVL